MAYKCNVLVVANRTALSIGLEGALSPRQEVTLVICGPR